MVGSNTEITTYRIVAQGGKESYSETPHIDGVKAFIEPIQPEPSALWNGESVFELHKCYVDGILDIVVSDRLIDSNGNEYSIKGVQVFRGGDVPSHTELTIVKKV